MLEVPYLHRAGKLQIVAYFFICYFLDTRNMKKNLLKEEIIILLFKTVTY